MLGRREHATTRKGITSLIVAAWVVLVIYTVVAILFVGFGITAQDRVESGFMFGYASPGASTLHHVPRSLHRHDPPQPDRAESPNAKCGKSV